MKRLISRRPSPAMIVALLALVMATVGTGYAAFKLPKNSVGTKQLKRKSVSNAKLKKNAVTGAKVKNASLTGADINLAKLGTVPSAELANSIPPAEPTHYIGAAGEPQFENGSSNYPPEGGISFPRAGFYKDHDGIVHLTGLVRAGTSGSLGVVFRLPTGFRPAAGTLTIFSQFCAPLPSASSCNTDSEGDDLPTANVLVGGSSVGTPEVNLEGIVGSTPGSVFGLDGISFRAES